MLGITIYNIYVFKKGIVQGNFKGDLKSFIGGFPKFFSGVQCYQVFIFKILDKFSCWNNLLSFFHTAKNICLPFYGNVLFIDMELAEQRFVEAADCYRRGIDFNTV